MDWLSDPANQLLAYGIICLAIGSIVLLWLAFFTPPEPVEIEHAPAEPVRVGNDQYVWEAPEPNYHRDDPFPLAEFIAAVDEATTVVIDLTETVELRAVDPLDVTAELEVLDPSVPLFYQIRRPAPFHLESFTVGWTTERIQRIKEMAP